MQALIIASRSINQDHFFQKQTDQKYKKHLNYIKSISNDKNSSIHEWENEVEFVSNTLRKSKSSAKFFKAKQEKMQLKSQNMHLLKKIWNLEPTIKTFNEDRFQYISGSNWNKQKKKLFEIKEQNKRNEKKLLLQQHLERNEYKKKLRHNINDYVGLRDSIRKFKFKDPKSKRSQSQRKLSAGLKLKKIESQRNIAKEAIGQQTTEKDSPQLSQSKQIKLI